jgi:hypothetical protein
VRQQALSPRTKILLDQLRGPARSLMQIVQIGDSPAGVLDQLGVCGEPLVLVHVLPYIVDKRRSVSRAAARAAATCHRLRWINRSRAALCLWVGRPYYIGR